MELQIICRRTEQETLGKLVEGLEFEANVRPCRDHFRLSDFPLEESKDLLLKCREVSYSYLRMVEWEKGGGFTLEGRAQCVAGIYGEKLVPLLVRDKGDRVCGNHVLFGSRRGLVVCTAVRFKNHVDIEVEKHLLEKLEYVGPEKILQFSVRVSGAEQDWAELLKGKVEDLSKVDPYLELISKTIEKSFCLHCVHCHHGEGGSGKRNPEDNADVPSRAESSKEDS